MISNPTLDLKEKILFLESKKKDQEADIRKELLVTYELLKPVNLIKNTVKDLYHSSEIRGSIVDSLLGLSAGLLSKKVLVGATANPLKLVIGSILQSVVSKTVSSNSGPVKETVINFVKDLLKKKDKAR